MLKSRAEPPVIHKLRVAEKEMAVKSESEKQMCVPPEPAAIRGVRFAASGAGRGPSWPSGSDRKGECGIYMERVRTAEDTCRRSPLVTAEIWGRVVGITAVSL